MVNLVKSLFSLQPIGKRRAWSYAAAVLVATLTLLGIGKGLLEAYESLGSTDKLIKVSALLSGVEARAIPVTLVEVDDETRARWGNPVITPHKAIALMIRAAREGGARVIVVDLDLSGDSDSQPPAPELYNEIAHYPVDAPPLYIVRAIRFRGASQPGEGQTFLADSYRKTPYDSVVASGPNISWISALPSFGSDRVVRKVRFWQTVCDGAAGEAFPSAALAVAAALENQGQALKSFLDRQVAVECGGRAGNDIGGWPQHRRLEASIPFAFGNSAKTPVLHATGLDGRPTALLRRIGAWSLIGVSGDTIEARGEIDAGIFRDRAVLIGVTHADSRDIYATPLGSMPGVTIIANTVALAKVIAGTPAASPFIKNILAIAFFLIVAFIGIRFQAAPAVLLIGLAGFGTLLLVSRWFGFATAVEVIALGLTVFALYKIADSIVGIVVDWRSGRGWRAIFKERSGKH
ncbi:MAG: CHASE2 domain-containing protein [Rhizobiales bacterium]|nr:CHASE2 domain-containing protein [Hyphomicrobiales bacterium]